MDAKQDILNYALFIKYSDKKFLKMFLPKELHYILRGKLSKAEKEKIIKEYVLENFKKQKEEIRSNIKEINRQWKKVEKDYFGLMSRVFKNHPWPKGKYIGFASVFTMFPRDVDDKTFYFSGFRKNINFCLSTTAHEMIHFIFFDCIKEKYNITQNTKFPYVWNVSEVFNLVIEKWKPYVDIFRTKGIPYDKAHAKMLPKMEKIWKESEDIDILLKKYFE